MPIKLDSINQASVSTGNYCHAPYFYRDAIHITAIDKWQKEKGIKEKFLSSILLWIKEDDRTHSYTAHQLAKLSGLSVRTVQRYLKDGLQTGAFQCLKDHNRAKRKAAVYVLGPDAPLWSTLGVD